MIPWQEIETVLLDMDGTLLDLHYDNHFWLDFLPNKLAERDNVPLEQAREDIYAQFEVVAGTIDWYCLDYWTEKLNINIAEVKREIKHLIQMRPDTLPFLDALHETGRKVVLVTNAHPGSLSLKIERTQLDQHIDTLISTHEFGVTKESQLLWEKLQARLGFDPKHTLFVDDTVRILEAAQTYGIQYNLAVSNPDSKEPVREIDQFPSVADYRTLLDDIRSHPWQG